jgi:hypothetical protein
MAAGVSAMLLLASCRDKRVEAGLIGSNPVVSISWSAASIDPLLEVSVDQVDRVHLAMVNVKDARLLPTKLLRSRHLSFEQIAKDLAAFRPVSGYVVSDCGGFTDVLPVSVQWHHKDGAVASYVVLPGCSRAYEKRFLRVVSGMTRQLGLSPRIGSVPAS